MTGSSERWRTEGGQSLSRPDWTGSPYTGATAVVFGASGFIGRWVARRLADAGARTVLAVRDRRRAESVLAGMGVKWQVDTCDVTSARDVAALLRRVQPAVALRGE